MTAVAVMGFVIDAARKISRVSLFGHVPNSS